MSREFLRLVFGLWALLSASDITIPPCNPGSDTTNALTWLSNSNSSGSIDDFLNNDEGDFTVHAWKEKLQTFIEQIVNLKRSSTEGRADSLRGYTHILRVIYGRDEIVHHMGEILPSILKSIKTEASVRETVTALKGMVVFVR